MIRPFGACGGKAKTERVDGLLLLMNEIIGGSLGAEEE